VSHPGGGLAGPCLSGIYGKTCIYPVSIHRRRSPQYEKLAHDERRAPPPRDEEAAKPTDSNGDGHAPAASTLPISSDLASPGTRAAAPAAPPENLLTLASVMKTGAVRCLQLDTEALISCREGLKSWCVPQPTHRCCPSATLQPFSYYEPTIDPPQMLGSNSLTLTVGKGACMEAS